MDLPFPTGQDLNAVSEPFVCPGLHNGKKHMLAVGNDNALVMIWRADDGETTGKIHTEALVGPDWSPVKPCGKIESLDWSAVAVGTQPSTPHPTTAPPIIIVMYGLIGVSSDCGQTWDVKCYHSTDDDEKNDACEYNRNHDFVMAKYMRGFSQPSRFFVGWGGSIFVNKDPSNKEWTKGRIMNMASDWCGGVRDVAAFGPGYYATGGIGKQDRSSIVTLISAEGLTWDVHEVKQSDVHGCGTFGAGHMLSLSEGRSNWDVAIASDVCCDSHIYLVHEGEAFNDWECRNMTSPGRIEKIIYVGKDEKNDMTAQYVAVGRTSRRSDSVATAARTDDGGRSWKPVAIHGADAAYDFGSWYWPTEHPSDPFGVAVGRNGFVASGNLSSMNFENGLISRGPTGDVLFQFSSNGSRPAYVVESYQAGSGVQLIAYTGWKFSPLPPQAYPASARSLFCYLDSDGILAAVFDDGSVGIATAADYYRFRIVWKRSPPENYRIAGIDWVGDSLVASWSIPGSTRFGAMVSRDLGKTWRFVDAPSTPVTMLDFRGPIRSPDNSEAYFNGRYYQWPHEHHNPCALSMSNLTFRKAQIGEIPFKTVYVATRNTYYAIYDQDWKPDIYASRGPTPSMFESVYVSPGHHPLDIVASPEGDVLVVGTFGMMAIMTAEEEKFRGCKFEGVPLQTYTAGEFTPDVLLGGTRGFIATEG